MRRQDNHQATYEEQFTHAEMTGLPSTPPPRSHVDRPRTPDAPLHGPLHDNYEPYTPRRSTRSTAHNNPYSSLNTGHGSPRKTHVARDTLPPSTARKSRAQPIGAHPSPPSSPNSPSIAPHKTPKKTPRPGSLQPKAPPPSWDPTGMLPTPSKTPKKRTAAITSTAHMLNFQPADANDIMPTPRRMKKHAKTSSISALALGENSGAADGMIDVYTDSNARVPEMDESEENPFIGPRKQAAKAQERGRRTQHRSQRRVSDEVEMEERVQNEEGMIYVFRGRKVFRPFTDREPESQADVSDPILRQAGSTASRPLTRSGVKPQLLFASHGSQAAAGADDVDEEAITDIEAEGANTGRKIDSAAAHPVNRRTPPKASSPPQTAPPQSHAKSTKHRATFAQATPAVDDGDDDMDLRTSPIAAEASTSRKGGRSVQSRNSFDDWARTKSTGAKGARKREAEPMEDSSSGAGKRTRSRLSGSAA